MFDKYSQLKALNKWIEEKEKAYDLALDRFTMCISQINKGIIHGKKEQSSINCISPFVSALTRADFDLQLALQKKQKFLRGCK